MSNRPRATRTAAAFTTAIASAVALSGSSALMVPSAGIQGSGHARPIPAFAHSHEIADLPTPLSTSECLAKIKLYCYSPLQYREAYNYNPLYEAGITGKGRTIVIVDSFGSPTIQNDLNVFDKQWGLPDTTVDVRPTAPLPPFDPNNPDMTGWAGETTLDVEYAHAIAPGAKIILIETPVAETEGVQGFPEMMGGEKAVIDSGEADVISQSFGSTENDFPGFATGDFTSLLNLRFAFKDAAKHRVSVLASSGDNGVADLDLSGNPFAMPVDTWPSSDPLVTSVGATFPLIADDGDRLAKDVVAHDNDTTNATGGIVSGGGLSGIFHRPEYQDGVRKVVGDHRGSPDISISGGGANGVHGAAWMYYSYDPKRVGWHLVEGTSESCPIMAATVALADQVAGHRMGNIDKALYKLGKISTRVPGVTGIVDVTSGNIGDNGVTGYNAGPGYDLASGWGTINAALFVPALAAASGDE